MMQTDKELKQVVSDLFIQLKNDNVIYAEIRFAPLLHLEKGLSAEEVVEIVSDNVINNVHLTGVKAGVILCTLRHFNEAQSVRYTELKEVRKEAEWIKINDQFFNVNKQMNIKMMKLLHKIMRIL